MSAPRVNIRWQDGALWANWSREEAESIIRQMSPQVAGLRGRVGWIEAKP